MTTWAKCATNTKKNHQINIQCGKCECSFDTVAPLNDYPTIPCPYCRTPNRLPLVVGDLIDNL